MVGHLSMVSLSSTPQPCVLVMTADGQSTEGEQFMEHRGAPHKPEHFYYYYHHPE